MIFGQLLSICTIDELEVQLLIVVVIVYVPTDTNENIPVLLDCDATTGLVPVKV